jgi:hypothetical protein
MSAVQVNARKGLAATAWHLFICQIFDSCGVNRSVGTQYHGRRADLGRAQDARALPRLCLRATE